MKHEKKIISIIILIVIFLSCMYSQCLAFSFTDVINGVNKFENAASGSGVNESELISISNSIYNILLSIAIIVNIIVGIIIGIKLMTSEAENKAEAKKSLIVFFVGSVLVYAAFGIWKVLVSFLNTI